MSPNPHSTAVLSLLPFNELPDLPVFTFFVAIRGCATLFLFVFRIVEVGCGVVRLLHIIILLFTHVLV